METMNEIIKKELKKVKDKKTEVILDKPIKFRECAAIPCAYLGQREDFNRFLEEKLELNQELLTCNYKQ